MKICGTEFDLIWETRKRPPLDITMKDHVQVAGYGDYIGLYDKEGKELDHKMVYDLDPEEWELYYLAD